MTHVYLALGSNVGDSQQYLADTTTLLGQRITDLASAPLYRSRAVGYTDQADFLNTVVFGGTELSPQELLRFIKEIEKQVGRIKRFRWGPREVDIDIIFYGDQIIDQPKLHIPHVSFAQRDFVLKPLCDLDPKLVDPRSGKTVTELYAQLPESHQAIYPD